MDVRSAEDSIKPWERATETPYWLVDAGHWGCNLSRQRLDALLDAQQVEPQHLGLSDDRTQALWWFRGGFYVADGDLSAEDVAALALEQENRRRLKIEKAHALMAMREQLDSKARRQPIPQDVKVLVWQRDGGRCVECGSQENLEYDHVIPLAMGGSTTDRNPQLLCEICNRRKGATLG